MKPIVSIFVSLPILGILLFSLLSPPRTENNPSRPLPQTKQSNSQLGQATLTQSDFQDRQSIEEDDNMLSQKQASSMAKLLTPERQKKIVDFLMKEREPKYRDLFSAWHLDAKSSDRVLHLIREREVAQMMMRAQASKAVANSSLKEAFETAVEKHKEQNASKFFDDVELITILGYSRYEELKKLDARHENKLFNSNNILD